MKANCLLIALAVGIPAMSSAITFSIHDTVVDPHYTGIIHLKGSISMGPGETYQGWSQLNFPFLPDFSAGFNNNIGVTPAFLAWNGSGTYTGDFVTVQGGPGNYGWDSVNGMPLGVYDWNPDTDRSFSFLQVNYLDNTDAPQSAVAPIKITVAPVPEPATLAALALGALGLARKRRA